MAARNNRKVSPQIAVKGISPFLWFDSQAEDAANFYTTLFKGSRINQVTRYSNADLGRPGSVMSVEFQLAGCHFTALNGGPMFKFTPAVSFAITCTTQWQVDELWDRLSEGGKPGQCGWLEDRFGLSWQVVPMRLTELLSDPDASKVDRVVKAMLTMTKIDIPMLERAATGEEKPRRAMASAAT